MISLFIENLFISLSAIFANKTRSILTALGITIGVVLCYNDGDTYLGT